MFGVIVSGRPVLTESQTISPAQFAFQIPSQPPFSHIVVFLLPGASIPADSAAAVYVQLPPSADFKLLGAIANEKPSAIFKINSSGAGITTNGTTDDAMTDSSTPSANVPITLGISVEPAQQVVAQLAALKSGASEATTGMELTRATSPRAPTSAVPTKVLAQRIIENAFNFLSSFGGDTVPLKSFQDWWKKFESRIDSDPNFLERVEQGG